MPNLREKSAKVGNRRQTVLTAYRVFTTIGIVASLFIGLFILNAVSDTRDKVSNVTDPIAVEQTSKIQKAAAFLEMVGFSKPVYMGIKPGVEGEYPTFRVEAIGGTPIELFIRTTLSGGWQIQITPAGDIITGADGLASLASRAVSDWENMPPEIQPGSTEYDIRKYNYDHLAKYDADYGVVSDETAGWPRK